MSVTPESNKTSSFTSHDQDPTPKNEFKVPMNQRSYFHSPTDALVSPCTQKLMHSRRMPRKPAVGLQRSKPTQQKYKAESSLANKENKFETIKEEEKAAQKSTESASQT